MLRNFLHGFPTAGFKKKMVGHLKNMMKEFDYETLKSEDNVLGTILGSIDRFISRLTKPVLDETVKVVKDSPPLSSKYNKMVDSMDADINAIYAQQNEVDQLVIDRYNYVETEKSLLDFAIKDANEMFNDYTMYSDGADSLITLLRDRFNNDEHIDRAIVGKEEQMANLDVDAGVVTLPVTNIRTDEIMSGAEVSISFDAKGPTGFTVDPKEKSEGKMYGLVEGIRGSGEDTVPFLDKIHMEQDQSNVMDGNPDTFWECEVVKMCQDTLKGIWSMNKDMSDTQFRFSSPVYRNRLWTGEPIIVPRYREEDELINRRGKISNIRNSVSLVANAVISFEDALVNRVTVDFLVYEGKTPKVTDIKVLERDGKTWTSVKFENSSKDSPDEKISYVFSPKITSGISLTIVQPNEYIVPYHIARGGIYEIKGDKKHLQYFVEWDVGGKDVLVKAKEQLAKEREEKEKREEERLAKKKSEKELARTQKITWGAGGVALGTAGLVAVGVIGTSVGLPVAIAALAVAWLYKLFAGEKSTFKLLHEWSPKVDSPSSHAPNIHRYRWAIAIRDISVSGIEYAEEGVLYTDTYYMIQPIKSVSLKTKENIPFKENKYIKYFVSFDEGKSWHQIKTMNNPEIIETEEGGIVPSIIHLNSDVSEDRRNAISEMSYVDVESPYSVKLKIEFSRPTDVEHAQFYTPMLDEYELNVLLDRTELTYDVTFGKEVTNRSAGEK